MKEVTAKLNIVNEDEVQAKLDKLIKTLNEANTLVRELASESISFNITSRDGTVCRIEDIEHSD